jgi:hypothetical protein
MHKIKNKNKNKAERFFMNRSWIAIALLMASTTSLNAQELPPLPPLPGMAAPAETAEPAQPSEPSSTETAGNEEMPDFGLFDPSALPDTTMESAANNEASPVELSPPALPELGTESPDLSDVALPVSPPVNPVVPEIAEMPDFGDIPGFEEPAAPDTIESVLPDIQLPDAPTIPTIADAGKEGSGEDNLADIAPPELPKDPKVSGALADALPSWATDEALPSLKPSPNERLAQKQKEQKGEQQAVSDETKKELEKSIADLIDEQMQSGESYADGDDLNLDDLFPEEEGTEEQKRVVWPKNFKTQTLPPDIYRKQYRNANRHLPHAIYQQEIQAHLFGAVGANDPDAVRALLRTGAPLTVINSMGDDLVMHAVKSRATSTLQLVLALGANPSFQDRYGATPLHRAVFMGRQDMAVILLRAGANAHINDMSSVTPMAIAVARNDKPMMQVLGYYQSSQYSQNHQSGPARYQPY